MPIQQQTEHERLTGYVGGDAVSISFSKELLDFLENPSTEASFNGQSIRDLSRQIQRLLLSDGASVSNLAAERAVETRPAIAGHVTIEKSVARVHIGREFKLRGTPPRPHYRDVFKELRVVVTVNKKREEEWIALLICIAGSTALTAWLFTAAIGPIGWWIFAAIVLASAVVCWAAISQDEFKDEEEGLAEVRREVGSWVGV